MMPIHTIRRAALTCSTVLSAAALAACGFSEKVQAPLETQVTPQGAAADPSKTLSLLASGILATDRDNNSAYIRDVALFGREAFYFQLQDGRWVTGYFRDFNDYTSFATGNWGGRFVNLRNIANFKSAVRSASGLLSAAQSAAANGFAGTEEAFQVLMLVNTRHNLGTPVNVADQVDGVTPFVSRDSALRFVSGTLDAAYTQLQNGGTAFPFTLPTAGGSGFTGLSTPATYARFNRALKARVEAYRGSLGCGNTCYQAAAQALGQSFVTADLTPGNLNTGAYFVFSGASGDALNGIWNLRNDLWANMSITTDRSVPTGDARLSKLVLNAGSRSQAGSEVSTARFNVYPDNSSPQPIIDNEELWLLRAEIQWFTGDRAGAMTTLNTVARVAGGATGNRYATPSDDAGFLDALLAERRLSLLMEGHRWLDVRRFNRLAQLPAGGTGFAVATQQVVPQLECQARDRTGNAALKGPGCP